VLPASWLGQIGLYMGAEKVSERRSIASTDELLFNTFSNPDDLLGWWGASNELAISAAEEEPKFGRGRRPSCFWARERFATEAKGSAKTTTSAEGGRIARRLSLLKRRFFERSVSNSVWGLAARFEG